MEEEDEDIRIALIESSRRSEDRSIEHTESEEHHFSRLLSMGENGPVAIILSFLTTFDILESMNVSYSFYICSIEILVGRNQKQFKMSDFFFDSVRRSYFKSVQYMMHNNLVDERVYGLKALRIASKSRDYSMMKLLLSRRRIHFDDELNNTGEIFLLTESIEKRRFKLFSILVSYEHIDFSYKFYRPLRLIVDRSMGKYLKLLLPKIDPSVSDEYAIRTAVRIGSTECVEILLSDERVDPSYNDFKLIETATKKQHHDILNLLLNDYRVEPHINIFKECIEIAQKNSDWKSMSILCGYCEDIEEDEYINQMKNMIRHPLYKLCEYFSILFVISFILAWISVIIYLLIGILGLVILVSSIDKVGTLTVVIYSILFGCSLLCCFCGVILGFSAIAGFGRSYYQSQRWRNEHHPFSTV